MKRHSTIKEVDTS